MTAVARHAILLGGIVPPGAAIGARARRVVKHEHLTLYPSSPNVAAPMRRRPLTDNDASYLRLFVGLTRLYCDLRSPHFFSSGPGGIFASTRQRTTPIHTRTIEEMWPSVITTKHCREDASPTHEFRILRPPI